MTWPIIRINRRQLFWIVTIGFPIILLACAGLRWHSISAMQAVTGNQVQFFDGYYDTEWSGAGFDFYKNTFGPIAYKKFGPEKEAIIRVRARSLFEGPIKSLRIAPRHSKVALLLPKYRFLTDLSLSLDGMNGLDHNAISTVFESLTQCNNLESIGIGGFKVNHEDLAKLSKLPRLRFLSLGGLSLNDKDLEELSNLPHLKSLDLSNCVITGDPIKSLSLFSNLESLTFYGELGLEEEMFDIKRNLGDCVFTVNGVEIPNL